MTTAMRTTVVGAFATRDEAEEAIQELRGAGFDDEQLGFAMRGGNAPAGVTATDAEERAGGAAEGAATGLLAGGIVGGVGAALVSLLIPGLGPIIGGGILATVLGGAAVGAAAGGLLGALTGMGVPEQEAHYYQGEFEAGRPIVTVRAADRYAEALAIVRANGGYDMERGGGSGAVVRETATTTSESSMPADSTAGAVLGSAMPAEAADRANDAPRAASAAPPSNDRTIADVVPDSEGDALANLGVRPRTMEDAIPPVGGAGVASPTGSDRPVALRTERAAGQIAGEGEDTAGHGSLPTGQHAGGEWTPGSERVTRDIGTKRDS